MDGIPPALFSATPAVICITNSADSNTPSIDTISPAMDNITSVEVIIPTDVDQDVFSSRLSTPPTSLDAVSVK